LYPSGDIGFLAYNLGEYTQIGIVDKSSLIYSYLYTFPIYHNNLKWDVSIDNSGNMWIIHELGVTAYNAVKSVIYEFYPSGYNNPSSNTILYSSKFIGIDNEGQKWIAESVSSEFPPDGNKPVVIIQAEPIHFDSGEGVVLKWYSILATSVVDSNFNAPSLSGIMTVYPTDDTTYTITVQNNNGDEASDSVSVYLNTNVVSSILGELTNIFGIEFYVKHAGAGLYECYEYQPVFPRSADGKLATAAVKVGEFTIAGITAPSSIMLQNDTKGFMTCIIDETTKRYSKNFGRTWTA
jgi:hypothetical protein